MPSRQRETDYVMNKKITILENQSAPLPQISLICGEKGSGVLIVVYYGINFSYENDSGNSS